MFQRVFQVVHGQEILIAVGTFHMPPITGADMVLLSPRCLLSLCGEDTVACWAVVLVILIIYVLDECPGAEARELADRANEVEATCEYIHAVICISQCTKPAAGISYMGFSY